MRAVHATTEKATIADNPTIAAALWGLFPGCVFVTLDFLNDRLPDKAIYRAAAEQGDTDALNDLGWCYINGEDVEKDYDEAFRLISLAYAGNPDEPDLQHSMGYCLFYGIGTTHDPERGMRLFEASAEGGCEDAETEIRENKKI